MNDSQSNKKVIIVGGGIAGMEAAACLSEKGHTVTVLEKESKAGGNVANWHKLFPNLRDSSEVLTFLNDRLAKQKTAVLINSPVENIKKTAQGFSVNVAQNNIEADAVLLATGYQIFDATRKEEFGYGIYDNVITSVDMEQTFASGKPVVTHQGTVPKRVAFIHCVGSRDEKSGNHYCSKTCCVTAVKQAIELRKLLPETEIICFYIDLRMFGAGYEELYREAQEIWGIQFIRGRLSEAAENIDGSLQIKAEDTLSGRPLRMRVDLMTLMVGMEPSSGTKHFGKTLDLDKRMGAFLKPKDEHFLTNIGTVDGLFYAGTCCGPMTIHETITDARSAAVLIDKYLKKASL